VSRTFSLGRQLSVVFVRLLWNNYPLLLRLLISAHLGKGWPYDIFLFITGALLLALLLPWLTRRF